MTESFATSDVMLATPKRSYEARQDSEEHTDMTGGTAEASAEPGASFTAWDGSITGVNLELSPYRRIVQSWRSSRFPDGAPIPVWRSNSSAQETSLPASPPPSSTPTCPTDRVTRTRGDGPSATSSP